MIVDRQGQRLELGDVVVAKVVELGKWVLKTGVITKLADDCTGCGIEVTTLVLLVDGSYGAPTAMPCHAKPGEVTLVAKATDAITLGSL